MNTNKRRYKRYTVDCIKIAGRMLFANSVDIIDISAGGISLKTDRRLNMDGEYVLKLEGEDGLISLKGTVVRSSLHESRKADNGDLVPIYSVGMKFSNVSAEKTLELEKFIESYGEAGIPPQGHWRSGMRFNMRFTVSESGKASLVCPESYIVKKISLGGMLIETDNTMSVDDTLPMEIALPDEKKISFLGRIASCIQINEAAPDQHEIGIEFLNMPAKNSEILNDFISMLEQQ
jgi:c-di-GMP-binding flagellar brake protein YcgR